MRLEHQFHALGQACANASDLALTEQVSLQKVPYGKLKSRLLQQHMVLDVGLVGAPDFDQK